MGYLGQEPGNFIFIAIRYHGQKKAAQAFQYQLLYRILVTLTIDDYVL